MSQLSQSSVYLTGGSGFIGRHLRAKLFDMDVPVTLLVREGASLEKYDNEVIDTGDITDQDSVSVADHEIVVHLAAQTSIERSIDNPFKTWEVNADGTMNLLELARDRGVQRFLFASTASVYGSPEYLPIDESHPLNPQEPYGSSKLAGDGLTRSYASCFEMDTVVARLFNTFGRGQPKHNVIPAILSQAKSSSEIELGNLTPSRDFIYVKDTIKALLTILESGTAGAAYNVGRGESVSIGDLTKMITSFFDKDITIVQKEEHMRSERVEIMDHVADTSRLAELGWKPHYSVEEGIEHYIEKPDPFD